MNPVTTAAVEAAIVFGGKQTPVQYRDGSSETVIVPLMEISPRLGEYIGVAHDVFAAADFLCEKPAGWSRTLTPASVLDIAETGHGLNFTTARRLAQHRAAVLADLKALESQLGLAPAKPLPAAARSAG